MVERFHSYSGSLAASVRQLCQIESGTTQPNPRVSYQHRVMQLGECLGPQAGNLDFSGTFAKLSRIIREISLVLSPGRRNICKHLHSPSEQRQVVASLSGLRLPSLLVCDSGDRNRRILYALPGLGTERLRLQFVSL